MFDYSDRLDVDRLAAYPSIRNNAGSVLIVVMIVVVVSGILMVSFVDYLTNQSSRFGHDRAVSGREMTRLSVRRAIRMPNIINQSLGVIGTDPTSPQQALNLLQPVGQVAYAAVIANNLLNGPNTSSTSPGYLSATDLAKAYDPSLVNYQFRACLLNEPSWPSFNTADCPSYAAGVRQSYDFVLVYFDGKTLVSGTNTMRAYYDLDGNFCTSASPATDCAFYVTSKFAPACQGESAPAFSCAQANSMSYDFTIHVNPGAIPTHPFLEHLAASVPQESASVNLTTFDKPSKVPSILERPYPALPVPAPSPSPGPGGGPTPTPPPPPPIVPSGCGAGQTADGNGGCRSLGL